MRCQGSLLTMIRVATITDEELAEALVVIHQVANYLRRVDDPVPAFALTGVADALSRTINLPQVDD